MAQQGSSLQNYNNELVKCIEDLKEKREEARAPPPFCICISTACSHHVLPAALASPCSPCVAVKLRPIFKALLLTETAQVNRQIVKDEEEKAKIQNDLRMLTERLSRVNDSVARKVASRNE